MSSLVVSRCAMCGSITSKRFSSLEKASEAWIEETVANETCYRCGHTPSSPPPESSTTRHRIRTPVFRHLKRTA